MQTGGLLERTPVLGVGGHLSLWKERQKSENLEVRCEKGGDYAARQPRFARVLFSHLTILTSHFHDPHSLRRHRHFQPRRPLHAPSSSDPPSWIVGSVVREVRGDTSVLWSDRLILMLPTWNSFLSVVTIPVNYENE